MCLASRTVTGTLPRVVSSVAHRHKGIPCGHSASGLKIELNIAECRSACGTQESRWRTHQAQVPAKASATPR